MEGRGNFVGWPVVDGFFFTLLLHPFVSSCYKLRTRQGTTLTLSEKLINTYINRRIVQFKKVANSVFVNGTDNESMSCQVQTLCQFVF